MSDNRGGSCRRLESGRIPARGWREREGAIMPGACWSRGRKIPWLPPGHTCSA